jgi:hypothetical protein
MNERNDEGARSFGGFRKVGHGTACYRALVIPTRERSETGGTCLGTRGGVGWWGQSTTTAASVLLYFQQVSSV